MGVAPFVAMELLADGSICNLAFTISIPNYLCTNFGVFIKKCTIDQLIHSTIRGFVSDFLVTKILLAVLLLTKILLVVLLEQRFFSGFVSGFVSDLVSGIVSDRAFLTLLRLQLTTESEIWTVRVKYKK